MICLLLAVSSHAISIIMSQLKREKMSKENREMHKEYPTMRVTWTLFGAALFVSVAVGHATGQTVSPMTPADGHTIHVVAPHVVNGRVMGPFHHYCKVVSPAPIIECLIYRSTDPGSRLEEIEYIVAKSITRDGSVALADWNKYWHDHKQEIATGRVQVLDLPPEEAKKVADLVATTDGIIFHLWPHDEEVPSGHVVIPQSVGHVDLTESELKAGAKETVKSVGK
jgi:Protein of unknown function (DUF1264)